MWYKRARLISPEASAAYESTCVPWLKQRCDSSHFTFPPCSGDSSSLMTIQTAIDELSTVLTGLAPFTSYDVVVRGENAVGLSDPSATLQDQTHPAGMAKSL